MNDVRLLILENDEVKVWKTVISREHPLAMHRHAKNRIVIPLNNAKAMQFFEDSTRIKHVTWELGQAYWFDADPSDELHSYVNESSKVIEVIVVELKQ